MNCENPDLWPGSVLMCRALSKGTKHIMEKKECGVRNQDVLCHWAETGGLGQLSEAWYNTFANMV